MGKEKGGGFVFGGGEVKERQESRKKVLEFLSY